MKDRPDAAFRWHPAARLFDSLGHQQRAVPPGTSVIPDRPSAAALALAFAASHGFRIGGDGPAPTPGLTFETLTSGSSGTPRRIHRTQASWTTSFAVNAQLFGIAPGARVAILGRLIHSLSLYGAIEALHLGAEAHLLDDLRPDRQRKALLSRQMSHLYATPAQLRQLVEAGGPANPSLRVVLVGGSKLDPALRISVQTLAPAAKIHEFYGAAETSFITLTAADTPEGSVGRAYPGVEIDLRQGEIWVRSPYLFTAYAGQGGGASWADGWLSVGEVGRLQDGYLYLSGRAGRMVTVADQNVFPEEVELLMATLPGIRRVAVLPVADARRGSVLVAVVIGDSAQEAAILAATRATLGPLKSPKALIWRADWPELASGKTDLVTLQRGLTWPL